MSGHTRRYHAFDALRGILALVVAIGHAGVFPLFGVVGESAGVLDLLARAFRTAVFGASAVIAFFVISGFCIHYPFSAPGSRCPIGPFYARRYIRILVPVVATLAILKWVAPERPIFGAQSVLFYSTLWSVACEEIYYALYPALHRLVPKVGWAAVLGSSFTVSAILMWRCFPAAEWAEIGILPTAFLLFPIWLLGCYLAHHVGTLAVGYSVRGIWVWRASAWFVMWGAEMLHFHSPIHQTISMVPTGIVYFFWLRAEIRYYLDRTPWAFLTWAGQWSYSLYLLHPMVVLWAFKMKLNLFSSRGGWLVGMSAILGLSYLFYLLVERPSHQLARKIPLRPSAPAGLAA